jgi:hypothetical protein
MSEYTIDAEVIAAEAAADAQQERDHLKLMCGVEAGLDQAACYVQEMSERAFTARRDKEAKALREMARQLHAKAREARKPDEIEMPF